MSSLFPKLLQNSSHTDPSRYPSFERLVDTDDSLILDLGCGNGQGLRMLAIRNPHVLCVGCDISPMTIRAARNEVEDLSNAIVVRPSALSKFNRFDKIFALSVVCRSKTPIIDIDLAREAWKSCHELLKTTGTLIAWNYNYSPLIHKFKPVYAFPDAWVWSENVRFDAPKHHLFRPL